MLLADICLALLIAGLGFLLTALKIPMQGHPVLSSLLGGHGLLFGLVLPLLLYSLVPLAIIWAAGAIIVRRNR